MLREPHRAIALFLVAVSAIPGLVILGAGSWLVAAPNLVFAAAGLSLFVALRRWPGNRLVAVAALVLFGGWGVHRLYLGWRCSGWAMFAVAAICQSYVLVVLFQVTFEEVWLLLAMLSHLLPSPAVAIVSLGAELAALFGDLVQYVAGVVGFAESAELPDRRPPPLLVPISLVLWAIYDFVWLIVGLTISGTRA